MKIGVDIGGSHVAIGIVNIDNDYAAYLHQYFSYGI